MTANDVLHALGEAADTGNVIQSWNDSQALLPKGPLAPLQEANWRAWREVCTFGDEVDGPLARTAATIAGNEALRRLFWHLYWRLLLSPTAQPIADWPKLEKVLGEEGGVFYLLAALAVVPRIEANYARLGFPLANAHFTCQQVRHFCDDNYRRGNQGRIGLYDSNINWLRNYTERRYVRLGRLEYWLDPTPQNYTVFRHRRTGRVVALAAPGQRFDAEGYLHTDPARYREGEGWTTTFAMDETSASGYLLDPRGMGLNRQVTLALADWECVLKKGDPVLQMHIPSGGGMGPEACRDSLLEARDFFRQYCPDEPVRAITCASWIFSNLLETILPEDANLNCFLRELYLEPRPASGNDGLWFVFLQRGPIDFATAPRETSLQRRILAFLEAGGHWRHGGMFILFDDLDRYGSQVYRGGWSPDLPELRG
ncbi:MAG: acyltransferase domain-containing protein [Lentisphaeria bacterium]|jgi:hypothetical protein|nr:acyltransferase domain-containing protein [Lentisphaeria bacterium]